MSPPRAQALRRVAPARPASMEHGAGSDSARDARKGPCPRADQPAGEYTPACEIVNIVEIVLFNVPSDGYT